jgi:predicted DNA-binding helix-hairpin-helix protein
MNFRTAPDPIQKLSLLGDATAFEPAGAQPLQEGASAAADAATNQAPARRKSKPLPCVSEVSTPTGKKPVLKAMMTTACERNCYYCPFRAGRSRTQRITFSPDEMAATFDGMQRVGQVDGLFLSSGIIKGGVTAQDQIIDAAEMVRRKYAYRGYIHLKIMPGAEEDQIRRAMQLADRVSVNLEGPTEQRLQQLAPGKEYWTELMQRIQWISRIRRAEQLRTSVVTQFVVGAVNDTDLELLSLTEKLYRDLGLRRAYFSAFRPVVQTPFEHLDATSSRRELRLYQSSFLLRDYGWSVEDLPFLANTNLRLDVDPKRAWAEEHLREAPVELNRASREELLRVPGIGPKTADAILRARRQRTLREVAQLHRLGLRATAQATPYITLSGKRPVQQLSLFPVGTQV